MNKYFVNATYPKNFILLGKQIEELKGKAESIVLEAVETYKDLFNGEEPFFYFDLRYSPPFEKSFNELRRLQGVASEHVRFKSSYKGYIIIDVAEFIKHDKESYFQKSIRFLHDENDQWRYIFIVDKSNEKAAKDMAQSILEYLKYTKVFDDENIAENNHKFLKSVCEESNIRLDENAFDFIETLLTKVNINRNVIETIISDLSGIHGNHKISVVDLKEYFEDDNTIIQYMIFDSVFDKIMLICDEIKEKGIEHEQKI